MTCQTKNQLNQLITDVQDVVDKLNRNAWGDPESCAIALDRAITKAKKPARTGEAQSLLTNPSEQIQHL